MFRVYMLKQIEFHFGRIFISA